MNGYLADTNAISEYAKPNPNIRVMLWFEKANPDTLFASAITLGGLSLGIEDMPAGKRRSDLELWLATGLPEWFAAKLLPVTGSIAHRWGRLTIQAKRAGTSLGITNRHCPRTQQTGDSFEFDHVH